jgi:hypothetical protein
MVDFSIFSLSSSGALKKENIQYLLNWSFLILHFKMLPDGLSLFTNYIFRSLVTNLILWLLISYCSSAAICFN